MRRVPGSASADLLVGIGLDRADVIRALVREIGLNEHEAGRAWESAVVKSDAGFHAPPLTSLDAR